MNEIKIPSADMYFSKLSVAYGYHNIESPSGTPRLRQASCSDSITVTTILNALYFNQASITECDGETWKVSTCHRWGSVICVNCTGGCNTCPGEAFITNPCSTACNEVRMAAYAIMDITIGYASDTKMSSANSEQNSKKINMVYLHPD